MNSLPESHKSLPEHPILVSLATVMPDGRPQVTPVWADVFDGHVRLNTATGRQEDRNLRERKQVTGMVLDPENPMRVTVNG